MTRTRRPRPENDPTRIQILNAGRQLLRKTGLDEVVDVKLRDACELVKLTTGAGYGIWPNQAAYQADLARHLASTHEMAGPDSIADELADIIGRCKTAESALRRIAPVYLQTFTSNEDFYVALRLWSVKHPSRELKDALESAYRLQHDAFSGLYEVMLAHYGLRLMPGRTLDDLTASVTAVTEGFAIRHRFNPSVAAGSTGEIAGLYAESLVALLHEFTRPTKSRTRKKRPS